MENRIDKTGLFQGKWKIFLLLLGSIFFEAVGIHLKMEGKDSSWGGIILFGFCSLTFLCLLFTKPRQSRLGQKSKITLSQSEILIQSLDKSRKIPIDSIRLIAENTDFPSVINDHFLILIHDQGVERWEFQWMLPDFFAELCNRFGITPKTKLANSNQFKSIIHWPLDLHGEELFYLNKTDEDFSLKGAFKNLAANRPRIYIRSEIVSKLTKQFPQIKLGSWGACPTFS